MTNDSAKAALARLKHDQSLRSIDADRSRLAALGWRLDSATRATLTQDLIEKIRADRRFVPALQALVRMGLR